MEVLRTRREAGVTLVETLIALLILALVSISILTMFSQSMQLNITGADYTTITNIAKDKLEELLTMPYINADLDQGAHSETLAEPRVNIAWAVGEHMIQQGAVNPDTIMGTDPLTSTVAVANSGNLKFVRVTVVARTEAGIGRRDVTVQSIKVLD